MVRLCNIESMTAVMDELAAGVGRPNMVPPRSALPDTLPTDRLLANGKPVREIRDELRRIASYRNVGSVVLTVAQPLVTIGLALWINHPLSWLAGFLLMGPAYVRFAILGHEAAHKLLFKHQKANDWVGRWVVAYPGFLPLDLYRRSHFAHHREEFGPEEPDIAFYRGYPVAPETFWRRLKRDATGNSGWKNLKVLVQARKAQGWRSVAGRIFAMQGVVAVILTAFGYAIAGPIGLLAYPVFWLGPWLTVWRVLNRLRSIAEHGGLAASDDRRETTHHIRQSPLANFFFVPFNTGWHLAHHVDMGVPWRNLPKLHRELEAAGWVTPDYEYPNYRTFWKACRSGI